MRGPSFLSKLRRRSLWPVLALAYVLLFQSILGLAAANAHALAMAQHEVLGLGMLCLEDGRIVVADPAKSAPDSQVPDGDCLACKIACANAQIGLTLPPPPALPLHVPAVSSVVSHLLGEAVALPGSSRYHSDLANRAPPAARI